MMNLVAKIWRLIPYFVRMRIIRLSQAKFTVSVVAIVINSKNEILVLDHYIRPGATWGLPGGFIEPDEYPEKAIAREIFEETGLELENVDLKLVRTVNRHIEMLYTATAEGEVELKEKEIRDFGWFAPEDIPEGVSDTQRELVMKTLCPTHPSSS